MRDLFDAPLLHAAVAKLAPAAAGVAFVALAVRWFEPSAYGRFSLAFAAANLLGVVSVAWLSQATLRFASGDPALRPVIPRVLAFAAAWSAMVAAVAVGVGLATGLPLASGGSPGELLLFVLLTSALALNGAAAAAATSVQSFVAYRNVEFLRAAALLGLTFLLSRFTRGVSGLLAAYAVSTLLPSALLAFLLRPDAGPLAPSPALRAVLSRFLAFGWPITLWATIQAAQAFVERGILSWRLPPDVFGQFISAADVIVRGIGLVLMPVVTVLHPRVMASAGARRAAGPAEHRMLRGGLLLVVAGGVAATTLLVAMQGPLAILLPSLAPLPWTTVALLGLSAVSWVVALIGHKPLEIAESTFTMTGWLLAALGLQVGILVAGVGPLGVAAMPVASIAAAAFYVAGCTWSARRNGGATR